MSQSVRLDWMMALLFCRYFNMELATIPNKSFEVEFLQLINNSQTNHYQIFIGGTNEGTREKWYWSKNGELIKYDIEWNAGEPNNLNNTQPTAENCLALMNLSGMFKFSDLFCISEIAFVCEYSYQ